MNMRAIIAEDEQVARQAIARMAKASGIQVLAECADGAETIRCLQAYRPDVLFLDIQMPGIDGFGVLQGVPRAMLPAVIFTTAYDCYAVQAFEHNVLDYLLKPFDEERFCRAVERARLQLMSVTNRSELITHLARELRKVDKSLAASHRLVIRSRGKVEFLNVDDIDWIEAQHNYLRLHVGNEVHVLRQTIAEFETRLDPDRFLRIHRSLIVNVDRIRHLQGCGYGEFLVVLKNGKNLPLSRGYRDRLDGFLEKIDVLPDGPPNVGG
ncbi:MAG TPA: LytTR family DNA-binding domain-containing protein [Candidatus Sulfotelmatobacter sp.]|nr:LytTR family DNA-binding domain-containing protein [Candidatus Sulfotelmatobacter sp.]